MDEFSILTNRKRAIVALIHSVVFLLLASWQMQNSAPAAGLWIPAAVTTGAWILCGIYGIVSSILTWLFAISRGRMEKRYFGLCTVSATSGLLRTVVGDHGFHAGLYLRVIMLSGAVLVGIVIVRTHSGIATAADAADSESRTTC